jgi:hypothetical protein
MSDSKNTSSKKTGKSSVSNKVTDYKYSPRVENPNPKAASNRSSESGNKN